MKKQLKCYLDRIGLLSFANTVYRHTVQRFLSFIGGLNFRRKRYFAEKSLKLRLVLWWRTKRYRSMIDANYEYLYRYENEYTPLSKSQYGQELYALDAITGAAPGIFVEVGANDPIRLSNSYTLEQLAWVGVSFEPIESLCEKWVALRTTRCYPYLLGARNGYARFSEEADENSVYSYVKGFGKNKENHTSTTVRKKRVYRLRDVLHTFGIKHVDILFLDVEGYEKQVLKGMDFNKVHVKCIVVEDERTKEEKGNNSVRVLLKRRGFRLRAHVGGDDIYYKP